MKITMSAPCVYDRITSGCVEAIEISRDSVGELFVDGEPREYPCTLEGGEIIEMREPGGEPFVVDIDRLKGEKSISDMLTAITARKIEAMGVVEKSYSEEIVRLYTDVLEAANGRLER